MSEILPFDPYEVPAAEIIDLEVEKRRRGKLVKGAISLFRVIDLFTIEEVESRTARGLKTPLDLMPHEFWYPRELAFPRFGEEMLGKDF